MTTAVKDRKFPDLAHPSMYKSVEDRKEVFKAVRADFKKYTSVIKLVGMDFTSRHGGLIFYFYRPPGRRTTFWVNKSDRQPHKLISFSIPYPHEYFVMRTERLYFYPSHWLLMDKFKGSAQNSLHGLVPNEHIDRICMGNTSAQTYAYTSPELIKVIYEYICRYYNTPFDNHQCYLESNPFLNQLFKEQIATPDVQRLEFIKKYDLDGDQDGRHWPNKLYNTNLMIAAHLENEPDDFWLTKDVKEIYKSVSSKSGKIRQTPADSQSSTGLIIARH